METEPLLAVSWFGVAVVKSIPLFVIEAKTQEELDERMPELLKVPGKQNVRALRLSPIKPIDISVNHQRFANANRYICPKCQGEGKDGRGDVCVECRWGAVPTPPSPIDWVIVAPYPHQALNPLAVANIRDRATMAGVPFMFDGWGKWRPMFVPQNEVAEFDYVWTLPNRDGNVLISRLDESPSPANIIDGLTWQEAPPALRS
jgi:hypothetical protein